MTMAILGELMIWGDGTGMYCVRSETLGVFMWTVDRGYTRTHQPKEAGCGKIRYNEQNIHTLTHPVFI